MADRLVFQRYQQVGFVHREHQPQKLLDVFLLVQAVRIQEARCSLKTHQRFI